MPAFNLKNDGDELVENIRQQTWFPYKTGNLRDNALKGEEILSGETYLIKFDTQVAKYIPYLEEGKNKTIIRNNYRPIAGFATSFHTNYTSGFSSVTKVGKHMGFISDKTINYILDYFKYKYKGEIQ